MRTPGRGVKGNRVAGFRFTPAGETEVTLALDYPLHLVSGGGLTARDVGFRNEVEPLDRSQQPATWKIGGDAEELTTVLRYQRFPRTLQDALLASADGLRLDYYPRLEATHWFFPVRVVGVGEAFDASEDPARYVQGEYQWRELRIRHLATGDGHCGDSFEQLLTGNLLLAPRMHRDADGDGVADGWSGNTGADATPAIDDRAQRIALASAGGAQTHSVQQIFWGALPGDVYELSGELRFTVDAGGPEARVVAHHEDAGGEIQANVDATVAGSAEADWVPFTHTFSAAPAGTERLLLGPGIRALASGDDGQVWYRDLELRLVETS